MAIKDSTVDTTELTKKTDTHGVWPIVLLAVGDAIVFLVFAAIGRKSHGETSGFDALAQVTLTALPFAVGWFLVSPFVGAFRRSVIRKPGKMALHTFLAWLGGCAVAMLLRGIFVDRGVPQPTFIAVALISNTLFLMLWRLPFAWIYGSKHRLS